MEPFLTAAATWGERKEVNVVFRRKMDSWYAVIVLKDHYGRFEGITPLIMPRKKTKKIDAETSDEFYDRVSKALDAATCAARKSRIGISAIRAVGVNELVAA